MNLSGRTKIGIIACVLLVAGLFLVFGAHGPAATPDQEIRQSLKNAEDAARSHSPNGVMEAVSDDFKAGPLNKKRLNLLLMRAMNQGRGVNYDAKVTEPQILPSPLGRENERLVITRFAVFYTDSGANIWGGNDPVTLVMRRETQRKFLVFKEPRWRIVSVANLPTLPGSDSDDSGGLGGLYGL